VAEHRAGPAWVASLDTGVDAPIPTSVGRADRPGTTHSLIAGRPRPSDARGRVRPSAPRVKAATTSATTTPTIELRPAARQNPLGYSSHGSHTAGTLAGAASPAPAPCRAVQRSISEPGRLEGLPGRGSPGGHLRVPRVRLRDHIVGLRSTGCR
jgi:hypothetical protein